MLLRYLRSQDPAVADDLAGDVWVSVARRLGRFAGDETGFRSWLFTIARCRLVDHRRKVARRRTEVLPDERLDGTTGARYGRDPALVVLEQLSAQEAIDRLVADLSPEQAEVVLLRVVGGFDVGEVARMMGRSPGSVRVLCHRALRRLAAQLSMTDRAHGAPSAPDASGAPDAPGAPGAPGAPERAAERARAIQSQGVLAE